MSFVGVVISIYAIIIFNEQNILPNYTPVIQLVTIKILSTWLLLPTILELDIHLQAKVETL